MGGIMVETYRIEQGWEGFWWKEYFISGVGSLLNTVRIACLCERLEILTLYLHSRHTVAENILNDIFSLYMKPERDRMERVSCQRGEKKGE